jgi:hypothetical protein
MKMSASQPHHEDERPVLWAKTLGSERLVYSDLLSASPWLLLAVVWPFLSDLVTRNIGDIATFDKAPLSEPLEATISINVPDEEACVVEPSCVTLKGVNAQARVDEETSHLP